MTPRNGATLGVGAFIGVTETHGAFGWGIMEAIGSSSITAFVVFFGGWQVVGRKVDTGATLGEVQGERALPRWWGEQDCQSI